MGKATVYTIDEINALNEQYTTKPQKPYVSEHMKGLLQKLPKDLPDADKKLRSKFLTKKRKTKQRVTEKADATTTRIPQSSVVTELKKENKALKEIIEKKDEEIENHKRNTTAILTFQSPETAPQQIQSFDKNDAFKMLKQRILTDRDGVRSAVSQNTLTADNKNVNKIISMFPECGDDLLKCLLNKEKMKEVINDQTKSQSYRVDFLRTVVVLLEYLRIHAKKHVTREYLQEMRNILKTEDTIVREAQEDQRTDGQVIPYFDDYLKQLKTTYGENSLQNLIGRFFFEMPVRADNLKSLRLAFSEETTEKNDTLNYLVIPNNGKSINRMYMVLRDYKTKKLYKTAIYQTNLFSKTLKALIKNHLDKNGIDTENELIFKSTFLQTISEMNKVLLKRQVSNFGANIYRHMKISDLFRTIPKNRLMQEREKLAKIMLHSVAEQKKYVRPQLSSYYD